MKGRRYGAPRAAAQKISDSNRTIIGNAGSAGSAKRVYQVWRGSNRFFLGGRLIFGPDVRSLLLTVFLIVTPVILFAVFVSQRLVNEFKNDLGNLIVAIAIVLALYDLFLLFLTSGRDPGIVPRSAHPPEPEDDGCSSRTSTNVSIDWTGPHGVVPSLPPTKDILVNGIIVRVKYCHTCMLYRPPRCSHCSICNNCVERFDHHCPWVGQCIGKRNYRFFFMFVSSTTVLCLYVFAFCCVNLKKITVAYHCNLWGAILKSPVSGILIIYTFITVWFVGGLTVFHLYLVATNQTTYENFRYRYDRKMNPFNRGCVVNIKEIFFSRVPKSQNNFRAMVRNDSAAFTTSLSLNSVMSSDLSKTSLDLEMGGKRHGVAEEDFQDLQNHIESVSGLEQCGTLPRHSSWGSRTTWETTVDLEVLADEFGMEHGFADTEKIPEKSLKIAPT